MENASPAYMESPTPAGAPAPKKSRLWLWIVLGVVALMMLGGVGVGLIVWGLFKSGGDVDINLEYPDGANYNTNYNIEDTSTDWYSYSNLVGDADQGYSFLIPDDWTLDSDDPLEGTGSVVNYAFIYTDVIHGETTNHFEFLQQPVVGGPDITLAQYSSEFVDSLNEGITNGDFKLIKTDNRTVGFNANPAFSVYLGDDTTGERNMYVLTVIDNVEYEFGVFYFVDQEAQALADFEKVILTFEVK